MTGFLESFRHLLTDWRDLADWLVAIGTLALAFITVFLVPFQAWLRRPRFTLRVNNARPDCVVYPLLNSAGLPSGGTALNVRMLVRNAGRSSAENAEAYVEEVCRETAQGDWLPVSSFIPMNLNWADVMPEAIYFRWIAPGTGKHCNLVQITPTGPTGLSIRFLTILQPSNLGNVVSGPGRFRAQLRLAAANARPVTKTVEIEVRQWYANEAEMVERGIHVSVLD